MQNTSRSRWCKVHAGADTLGALPISLTSPLHGAPANWIHFSVGLSQSCRKMLSGVLPGHSTLEVPGTASSRSSLHQSLFRVSIKTPHHHSGGTLWRYVFNTVLEIFFPAVELQLPSVLTCLVRQLIGCFPLSSLSYTGFLHLQNKLLALESSIKGLLLENSK